MYMFVCVTTILIHANSSFIINDANKLSSPHPTSIKLDRITLYREKKKKKKKNGKKRQLVILCLYNFSVLSSFSFSICCYFVVDISLISLISRLKTRNLRKTDRFRDRRRSHDHYYRLLNFARLLSRNKIPLWLYYYDHSRCTTLIVYRSTCTCSRWKISTRN